MESFLNYFPWDPPHDLNLKPKRNLCGQLYIYIYILYIQVYTGIAIPTGNSGCRPRRKVSTGLPGRLSGNGQQRK